MLTTETTRLSVPPIYYKYYIYSVEWQHMTLRYVTTSRRSKEPTTFKYVASARKTVATPDPVKFNVQGQWLGTVLWMKSTHLNGLIAKICHHTNYKFGITQKVMMTADSVWWTWLGFGPILLCSTYYFNKYQTFEASIDIIMLHEYIKLIARAIYVDIPTWSHAVSLVSASLYLFFSCYIHDDKMSYCGSLK